MVDPIAGSRRKSCACPIMSAVHCIRSTESPVPSSVMKGNASSSMWIASTTVFSSISCAMLLARCDTRGDSTPPQTGWYGP